MFAYKSLINQLLKSRPVCCSISLNLYNMVFQTWKSGIILLACIADISCLTTHPFYIRTLSLNFFKSHFTQFLNLFHEILGTHQNLRWPFRLIVKNYDFVIFLLCFSKYYLNFFVVWFGKKLLYKEIYILYKKLFEKGLKLWLMI